MNMLYWALISAAGVTRPRQLTVAATVACAVHAVRTAAARGLQKHPCLEFETSLQFPPIAPRTRAKPPLRAAQTSLWLVQPHQSTSSQTHATPPFVCFLFGTTAFRAILASTFHISSPDKIVLVDGGYVMHW